MNSLKESYNTDGLCPCCGKEISDEVQRGDVCECGMMFDVPTEDRIEWDDERSKYESI